LNVLDYHNNKSIDVVDDEEDNVTLFTKIMQENGYHVIGFTNPLFSLIILGNIQINLV